MNVVIPIAILLFPSFVDKSGTSTFHNVLWNIWFFGVMGYILPYTWFMKIVHFFSRIFHLYSRMFYFFWEVFLVAREQFHINYFGDYTLLGDVVIGFLFLCEFTILNVVFWKLRKRLL